MIYTTVCYYVKSQIKLRCSRETCFKLYTLLPIINKKRMKMIIIIKIIVVLD